MISDCRVKWLRSTLKLCLLCSVLFIGACRTYYGDGLAGANYAHMQTPMAKKGESISKNYIGGKYNKDVNYYENEKNESYEVSYHHAVSKRCVNYAIGAFAFKGNYKVVDLQSSNKNLNKNYDYYGGGIRAKVAYNWSISPRVHWRIIGLQASWYMERGDYYNFKRDLIDLGEFEDEEIMKDMVGGIKDFTNITFHPYTEFVFRIGDSWQIIPHAGFGYKLNNLMSLRFFTGLNVSYRQFSIWGSVQHVGTSFDRLINNDFITKNAGSNTHSQLGLAWSF